MVEDIIVETLREIGYLLSATFIPLATLIVGRKVLREKKSTGQYNIIRLIIFGIFFCFAMMSVFEYLVELSWFSGEIFGYNISSINLYSILIGTMVSLGLSLVFYANRWEAFYYISIFIFSGMVIFYFLTGYSAWIEWYIQIAAVLCLAFMYFTSFRIKDNGTLGLTIFFTLAFSTLVLELSLINQIIIIIYNIFILILSLGFFKPFKEEVRE
ncbi:MAG: hypothetical protein ACFFFB_22310 [Candidatus Heimdallarchaeota archaeon]